MQQPAAVLPAAPILPAAAVLPSSSNTAAIPSAARRAGNTLAHQAELKRQKAQQEKEKKEQEAAAASRMPAPGGRRRIRPHRCRDEEKGRQSLGSRPNQQGRDDRFRHRQRSIGHHPAEGCLFNPDQVRNAHESQLYRHRAIRHCRRLRGEGCQVQVGQPAGRQPGPDRCCGERHAVGFGDAAAWSELSLALSVLVDRQQFGHVEAHPVPAIRRASRRRKWPRRPRSRCRCRTATGRRQATVAPPAQGDRRGCGATGSGCTRRAAVGARPPARLSS